MNFAIPLALAAAGGVAIFVVQRQRAAQGEGVAYDWSDALSGVDSGLGDTGSEVPEVYLEGSAPGLFTVGNTFSTEAGAANAFDWLDDMLAAFLSEAGNIFGGSSSASSTPYDNGGKPQAERGDAPWRNNPGGAAVSGGTIGGNVTGGLNGDGAQGNGAGYYGGYTGAGIDIGSPSGVQVN